MKKFGMLKIVGLVSIFAFSLIFWKIEQEPPMRTLSEQEIVDLLVGSCIQATRGAGSASSIRSARQAIADGKEFKIISVEDLPDNWMVVGPAGVGGGGAWEYVTDRIREQNLPRVSNTYINAINLLSDFIGKKFNAVIRIEPAGAMYTALSVAAEMGVPLVDACLSGRARPEIQQQIPWTVGIPSTPAALFTRWGDEIIIKSAVDDYRSEDLARAVAVASGGGASMAMNPMSGKDVKRGVIPGNLSDAILLGKTVREAKEQGKDTIAALVEVTKGYKLFHGVVTKSDQWGDRGFSWADVEMKGINEYEGHIYKVFVKNENIVSWFDGEVDVTSPDYIYNLNPETGEAITGGGLGGYPMEREIVMVGVPAHPMWRTEKGIEVLGPRHFGFDFDYTSIEELQKKRKKFD